jgi:hypothetical protein
MRSSDDAELAADGWANGFFGSVATMPAVEEQPDG